MGETIVRNGETPAALSARLGAPICAILRCNRLACAAWLLPGRVISVPDTGFCLRDPFPCPSSLCDVPAYAEPTRAVVFERGDDVMTVALSLRTAERLVLLALAGRTPLDGTRISMPEAALDARVLTVLPGETLVAFAARSRASVHTVAGVNQLQSTQIWPGMRLAVPDGERKDADRRV